jgi:hypothetical protein
MWFFSHENFIAITDQAQSGCGMGQNTVSKPSGDYFGCVRINGKLIRWQRLA